MHDATTIHGARLRAQAVASTPERRAVPMADDSAHALPPPLLPTSPAMRGSAAAKQGIRTGTEQSRPRHLPA